jgi:predicted RNase H-like nuclease
MGEKNSSETRVRPVFNELLDHWPTGREWLAELCAIAARTRGNAAAVPLDVGQLLPSETPASRNGRLGKIFERTVAPPGRFLRWLLEHPERMQVDDAQTYGASSALAQRWRRKLFSSDPRERRAAEAEGVTRLLQRGAEGSRHEWWAFEGFTHTDCCLITDRCVFFVEGKRTESVSPSTRWFKDRSQLWRNVEGAHAFSQSKEFAVILAVEHEEDGKRALDVAAATLDRSYPHLPDDRAELSRHLLGFVTWATVVQAFSLPDSCLPANVDAVRVDTARLVRSHHALVGIDGCAGGWIVATSDASISKIEFSVVRDISDVLDVASQDVVAIDIPIGLASSGARPCDVAARRTLGSGQGSRVFPAPSRLALGGTTYKECCDLNRQASGTAISKQAHALLPKIVQVDRLMTRELQGRVREVHPEVSFCVINGGPLQHRKKTIEGQQERLTILGRHGVTFDPVAERRRLGTSRVAIDDLLDAAVALLTARRVHDGAAQMLGDGLVDARGLRMEIVA